MCPNCGNHHTHWLIGLQLKKCTWCYHVFNPDQVSREEQERLEYNTFKE